MLKKDIKETDIPTDISGKILSVKLQEKDQCIYIHDVFAAYSSVAGNMIDWYEITKKRLPEQTIIYRERLVPDCCGAGIELARRGIVNYFYSQLSPSCFPLFKEEHLISQKKDIIFYNNMKELTYPVNLNSLVSKEQWKTIKDLSSNKILKEDLNSSGFNWYRNPPSDVKMGVARCYYSCNGAIDLNIIEMIYLSFFIYYK